MVPTYLPTSARHLDFNNLVGSYDSSAYPDLRGWGELSHPSGPVASVGSWAAPTSPPAQPHNAEEADRPHEDSKSGVLGAAAGQWETPTTTHLGSNYEAEMQRYRDMMALGGEGWLHNYLPPAPPANGAAESKLAMEAGSSSGYPGGAASSGRPQSSTSLSPPSHLAMPQPINPRGLPNNMLGLNGQRKYQCKMCPQAFHSKADLQLHTQIHLREPKPYKCATCGKAFANSSYLSQHTRIHLGIKPYRCEICQRKFTQLSHLQQHIRTHTGDKPYKCRVPGCTKAFSQLSNLQSHSRCHQSDKPYKCNSCYKCFTDEPALLEHIPKHRDSKHVKTHICAYCGKSYTQETYLAKHMQKHADRVDKRAPINAGPGHNMPSLSDPYWPGKMDPLAAMYGYHHQPLADHRLGELDPRDQGYSGAGWDPRTSSAFSPLQPPQAPVAHKTTSAHGFDLKSFEQKATSNFEQKGFDLKGFDQKVGQGFDASSHFAKVSTQSAVQQDMKGGFISLASIRNYSSDKPSMTGEKQQ